MSKFADLWKKKNVVEKPGDATHTAKWDRCVEHVKANGSGANAYAVCTAMMDGESFKTTETDEEFKSRVDGYIKRLNITSGLPSKVVDTTASEKNVDTSFAGAVPNSLLARQDLETTKTAIVKDGSDHELTIEIHNGTEKMAKAVFEGCKIADIVAAESYKNVTVFVTPEMQDANGKRIGCHIVLGQDGSPQVFFSLKDAHNFIDSVFGKGQVEETGKELIEMAETAKDEGEEAQSDLVGNITRVQEKRQKATLTARKKETTSKTFKEIWGSSIGIQ